jgi:hypothetical protein
MPDLKAKTPKKENSQSKTKVEKDQIKQNYHTTIQNMQKKNRKDDIDRISCADSIRLLRIKYNELERGNGVRPLLKQNFKDHVNTFYDHEGKFLAERAQLYENTNIYNPYLLKQYIDDVKSPKTDITDSKGNNL